MIVNDCTNYRHLNGLPAPKTCKGCGAGPCLTGIDPPARGGSADAKAAVLKPDGWSAMEAGDYAYAEFLIAHDGRLPNVYLDGIAQPLCDLVDQRAGKVRRAIPDVNGHAQLTPSKDEILRETVYGDVDIRPKP